MPSEARLGGLTLRARDLRAMRAFYGDLLGLAEMAGPEGIEFRSQHATLEIRHDPRSQPPRGPVLGLYHLALRLPDRAALAQIVRRLLEAGYPHWEGASDHGFSEALYLRDPEGNGVELYVDRPRTEWPRRDGRLWGFTRPLDIDSLLKVSRRSAPLPPETELGHIHLHVPDLEQAEAFFSGLLGLHVTIRDYPGARFFAAGHYHHHIGTNTWVRNPAPDNATGLLSYRWRIPHDALKALEAHLRTRRVDFTRTEDGIIQLRDPLGHGVSCEPA